MGDRRQMVWKRFWEVSIRLGDDMGARLCITVHLLPIQHHTPSTKSPVPLRQSLDRRISADRTLRYFKRDRHQITRCGMASVECAVATIDAARRLPARWELRV